MSHVPRRALTRVAAGLVGAVIIGAGGVLGAGAAHAAAGNIDTTTAGSITIHKHLETGATSGANPDGSGSVAGAAVANVQFSFYQLRYQGAPVDLTNVADWNGLSSITLDASCNVTGAAAAAGYSTVTTSAPAYQKVTDATGALTVSTGTTRTAFAVCETSTAAATVAGAPVSIVTPAKPFVVSVPTPYNNSWLYNVNAYPKNVNTAVEKAVNAPSGYGLGSTVDFPVSTSVPAVAPADQLTSFIVRDVLDTRLGSPTVPTVTLDGTAVDPTYWSVKVNAGNANDLRVVFNSAGLTWLKTQAGKKVVVTFRGTVTAVGNQTIANTATAYVNNPGSDADTIPPGTPPGTPSNQVSTNWGDLVIRKYDAQNNLALSGASFQVYAADPAYPAAGGSCTSKVTSGSPIPVSGTSTFQTGADGTVTVPGLFVSDSGHAPVNALTRCYVVVETAAPAGYTLPSGDAAKTAVAVNVGKTPAGTFDANVANTKQSVPALPLTGAAGQTVAAATGAGLLLVGAVLVIARRRRRATASQQSSEL